MSSSIKLTNSSGKIVTITNPDTTSADVAVDLLNNAYTIATVDDFGTVPVGYTTVIVKDTDRGGIFVWSASGTANGGTVFAGSSGYWIRQYSGAVDVKWFGAVGDGIVDDTVAIQNAINSQALYPTTSHSGVDTPLTVSNSIYLPAGLYAIDTLYWRSYVSIIGEASSSVFFIPLNTDNSYMFTSTNDITDRPRGIEVRNISVSPSTNVSVEYPTKPTVNGFNIEGFEKQCLFDNVKVYNINGIAIKTGDTQDMLFNNIEVRFCYKALDLRGKYVGELFNFSNALKFSNCRFEQCSEIYIVQTRSTHFTSCKFENCDIRIADPFGLSFIGCDYVTASTQFNISGVNQGISIVGGIVEGGGRFIYSIECDVYVSNIVFKGMGANTLYGKISANNCTFYSCTLPYLFSFGIMTSNDLLSISPVGTGIRNDIRGTYEVANTDLARTNAFNTWYTNNTDKTIECTLKIAFAGTDNGFIEVKKKVNQGDEYQLITLDNASGRALYVPLTFTLLPSESFKYGKTGTVTVTNKSFYR